MATVITVAQCKAARALLGWRQHHLADAALIGLPTLINFEGKKRDRKPTKRTITSIQRALEEAGIRFIGSTGVDLPRSRQAGP